MEKRMWKNGEEKSEEWIKRMWKNGEENPKAVFPSVQEWRIECGRIEKRM